MCEYPCKNISITGGEPLLQKEELLVLIKKLKELGYWIQINTNGTLFDREIFELNDLITMDCKCPSSEEKSVLQVIEKTKNLFNYKTQFKFIISNEKDYNYAKNILTSNIINTKNVIFQPEWNNKKFTKQLAELIKNDQLNAKIILQQQKIIWGLKKGV